MPSVVRRGQVARSAGGLQGGRTLRITECLGEIYVKGLLAGTFTPQIREKRPPTIIGVGPDLRTPVWQGRVKNVFIKKLAVEYKWMLK